MPILKTLVILPLLIYQCIKAFGLDAPLHGYGVDILTWEVKVFPREPPMNFSGTIQEVQAQINKVNPKWNATYFNGASEKRRENRPVFYQTICGPGPYGWNEADASSIKYGINYLGGLIFSKPINGPGTGNCGRVSCSYNSAIWWCNDNTVPYQLDSFSAIADGALNILKSCTDDFATVGQIFAIGNWNVIVRGDNDNC
ncbi:Uncharacterized protein TPAR_05483 [Tolypocladium paradoxum]|uniref:Secreted protein n=1 Tax=Tolypocladium paradoxum TaxID=94208 RepID=A0A2S4KVY9_9HYPO|nr:Uncharacterized protein TPAR_05483 [Tolypocladium paradoxum]